MAVQSVGLASRTGARTDPCRRRPPSLSLTSGALRPLSLQHLISPLNLRLTRSFGSKGLPLCLQPSSTNGAWRGIEGRWRVAAVSAVARWKNQPRGEKREPSEVNRAARGLRNGGASWAEVCARGWEPLFIAGRGCWHCHVPLIAFLPPPLLTPPLIKINGPSRCWPAYYQFIHQMGWDAASVAPYVAKTLTVLEQTSAQLWGKVSTSGPNKWYGLNGRGNDFYPSSLIWPGGRWWGGCWGWVIFCFTISHLDTTLI